MKQDSDKHETGSFVTIMQAEPTINQMRRPTSLSIHHQQNKSYRRSMNSYERLNTVSEASHSTPEMSLTTVPMVGPKLRNPSSIAIEAPSTSRRKFTTPQEF